jgi:polyferredoxin
MRAEPPSNATPPAATAVNPSRHVAESNAPSAKRHAEHRRPVRPFDKRLGVQLLILVIVLVIGYQFAGWVGHLEQDRIAGTRPPGVEGFLPISALISLKHWITTGEFPMVHPAGLVIFSLALLTGLLLKKAFCSWLCPIGTIAEQLARLSHRVFGRRLKLPRWLDYPLMALKYLLLLFFAHAIFFGMSAAETAAFLDSPYNKVADIKMLWFFTQISTLALQILIVLVVLSFVVPYFWCRFLCPYGALLGLLSTISPLKVRRSIPDCTACGKCAAVCPSYLPVDRKTTVSSPECTVCLECVVNCPEKNALQVRLGRSQGRHVNPVAFGALVVALFFGGIGAAKLTGHWQSDVSQQELLTRVQNGLDGPEYDHLGR